MSRFRYAVNTDKARQAIEEVQERAEQRLANYEELEWDDRAEKWEAVVDTCEEIKSSLDELESAIEDTK